MTTTEKPAVRIGRPWTITEMPDYAGWEATREGQDPRICDTATEAARYVRTVEAAEHEGQRSLRFTELTWITCTRLGAQIVEAVRIDAPKESR